MANIQIGKYKRPGIFIEEFDQSVFTSPTVEGITNLVIGVSKKGPVNTPIRLTTTNDLETIFGQLDRGLERKGSFFHRTVSKMLESAPVYAMNLLLSDDTLDVIEYKSISTSAGYNNDILREGPYRRFFDTTGFWKRDTESFINLTTGNTGYDERSINFTNMSDKPISVFAFKSALTGFDRTLLEWYGSIDKMPPYVHSLDYASDYMVDVVVVGGDWSNYQELAVDPRWSSYFNSSGLIKEQVRNFANNRNVNLLAYYEGLSLIPYFKDLNGNNIFIETIINRDTDKTGLFCAFNNDLVEVDFYNGLLDLIGNTIVGVDNTTINFLSYSETITESVQIDTNYLDKVGNVTSLIGTFSHTSGNKENGYRNSIYSEGYVYGVTATHSVSGTPSGTYSINVYYNATSTAYAIIEDTLVNPITTTFSIPVSSYPTAATSSTYVATFVLGADGVISVKQTWTENSNPTVLTSDIVLGYATFTILGNYITNLVFTHVSVNTIGYVELAPTTDYIVTDLGGTSGIKIEFVGTNVTSNVKDYQIYRRFKMFNRLITLIDSSVKSGMTMLLSYVTNDKLSLENIIISNITTYTFYNKSFVLSGFGTADITDLLRGFLVFYTVDDELLVGSGINAESTGMLTQNAIATATHGVVAKYSTLYEDFYSGLVNTGDYFYTNRFYSNFNGDRNGFGASQSTVDIEFAKGEDLKGITSSYAGYSYIIFSPSSIPSGDFMTQVDLQLLEVISIPGAVTNTGTFTIVADSVGSAAADVLAVALGLTGGGYFAYQVSETVSLEVVMDVDHFYEPGNSNGITKVYLKMYLDGEVLNVDFCDSSYVALTIDPRANLTMYIQSANSNLKQTVEIEVPTGYTQVSNKILIDATRYSEVKIGDLLEAEYDSSTLEVGEVARKLTRILSKKQYPSDTTLAEVTCDSSIKKTSFGGDLQTTRYVSVDNYATTYKTMTFKGFKLRTASLPDGTEAKQNSILNLVASGTPLFKALTNKEAIDFRYLIDSFGLGLSERSKQQLVDICGSRLDVFGFINMPSIRSFRNSTSPTFVDAEGVLQVEYISKGGNPESNPAFLYSFGDGAGTTCTGYFTPFVIVNDNGRPLEFPPASFIASTYMRKHVSNITSITPWTIAAGVTNGKVTNITGLEIDFTNEDIEWLNGAQMNPVVYKRNRGYIIETENTGQTLYKSALSYIHVREVLVELERELSRMLLDYQWKYNTADVRAEIKLRADVICETYVNKNGLYNYFNKMDDENNTPDIIDSQIGVIDTYVEPIKGMGVIVNNITILRTGAISAGGFING